MEGQIGDKQFRFRTERSTQYLMFTMRQITEKCAEKGKKLFGALSKAFD